MLGCKYQRQWITINQYIILNFLLFFQPLIKVKKKLHRHCFYNNQKLSCMLQSPLFLQQSKLKLHALKTGVDSTLTLRSLPSGPFPNTSKMMVDFTYTLPPPPPKCWLAVNKHWGLSTL